MAPNPVLIPRQPASHGSRPRQGSFHGYILLTTAALFVSLIPFARTQSWAWSWLYSGAAIESLLLVYGSFRRYFLQHGAYLWISLVFLNFTFILSTTSWLLRPLFIASCYLAIIPTCLIVFPPLLSLARQFFRHLVPGVYVVEDKISFFEVPALEIDTEVNGLFVVRGIAFSFADLSIEAHGIELGLRVNNDVELALCADRLSVRLFRDINLTDVYGNIKVDRSDMMFSSPEAAKHEDEDRSRERYENLFTLAKLSGVASLHRPSGVLPSSGGSGEKASPADKTHSDHETKSANDSAAKAQHTNALEEVQQSSQIYVARAEIERGDPSQQPRNEREMRQAVCAKLQNVPAISHMPVWSVKVSFLQRIFPRLRRFLHRLPLLLRLLLNPLSYFHPIYISSISVAGPGEQVKRILQDQIMQDGAEHDSDMQQLEEEMSSWLSSASFCLEISDLSGLGHVPVISSGNITTYLRGGDVSIYRTPLDSDVVTQVSHLGGADGTFVIPAFLLPHHEHCLPPAPREDADGDSDETEMTISVHASLPTSFDQSLLDFAATFLKATKMIDLENLFESSDNSESEAADTPGNVAASETSHTSTDAQGGTSRDEGGEKESTSASSKIADKVPRSVKSGIKKALKDNVLGDKINDRWVARTVGRIAARLEKAKGDFGYTTTLSVPLKPYRDAAEPEEKLLP